MADRVEWVTDLRRFAALRDEWDQIARGPFECHAWYSAWWSAFSGRRRLAICTLWDGEELAAVLPLCRSRARLESMTNVHSPVFKPLSRDPATAAAILDAALAAGPGVLRLAPLPNGEGALGVVLEACERARRLVRVEPQEVSPITDTSGDFSSYREERRREWREIERRGRKLAREHRLEARLVEPPDDLDTELVRGFEVEASGWKGRGGTAITSSASTRLFYWSLARAFHARGELVLSTLAVEGRPIAFDLAILQERRYWLLKTGFDESFRALAPGLVMRRLVIERCFERGLAAHEFLGDAMDWKRPFATSQRAHVRVLAYRRRPGALGRYAIRGLPRQRVAGLYERLRHGGARTGARPRTNTSSD